MHTLVAGQHHGGVCCQQARVQGPNKPQLRRQRQQQHRPQHTVAAALPTRCADVRVPQGAMRRRQQLDSSTCAHCRTAPKRQRGRQQLDSSARTHTARQRLGSSAGSSGCTADRAHTPEQQQQKKYAHCRTAPKQQHGWQRRWQDLHAARATHALCMCRTHTARQQQQHISAHTAPQQQL